MSASDNTSEEEFIPEEEAEEGPVLIKGLREKLRKALEEKQEYLDSWQRSRADFANFKRQEASLNADREERLRAEFAEAVIPALDSFEIAFRSPSFETAAPDWKNGVIRIYKELQKSLEKFGIISFSPLGEPFDPTRHEALREVEIGEEDKDHTVASVERSGYTLGEKVIRPAQVSIGRFKQHNS